ncbi:MAG: biotin transporter BioY [Acidobacteria bacterium]|nr:biotin transporter BioY [Acidobacteriaceae bacterium]MBV9609769.1 biotin transporter BioY [Acidobacteriota bacterium]
MIKSATRSWPAPWVTQVAVVFTASLFVALFAHITIPLPFTPVPLTLQNFAVLVVGLALGSRRGFAALALYLAEGLSGLPVFNPTGPGGIAQLLGPTGGYLIAYPLVAFVAGWIAERGRQTFVRYAIAATAGEIVLFFGGVAWLALLFRGSWWQAVQFGLYPFLFAEVAKVLAAAGACQRIPANRLFANGSN